MPTPSSLVASRVSPVALLAKKFGIGLQEASKKYNSMSAQQKASFIAGTRRVVVLRRRTPFQQFVQAMAQKNAFSDAKGRRGAWLKAVSKAYKESKKKEGRK
jgi:hypothetical protein